MGTFSFPPLLPKIFTIPATIIVIAASPLYPERLVEISIRCWSVQTVSSFIETAVIAMVTQEMCDITFQPFCSCASIIILNAEA